ncbi:TonB-dependent receptor [Aquimarina sp. U1-2]|uniref:TonB-dependent receptor plug domain-containing protein n=1 Tax=Aquimarina sp. U1-2 TaxID=2823141 RepID=UPI001AEC9AF2|nr:TonB-dependent receptor [Aquimarina sp. U1-2]MBP2832387.1 TonB-dependent receptor [Aquimarina sp. U1-2]
MKSSLLYIIVLFAFLPSGKVGGTAAFGQSEKEKTKQPSEKIKASELDEVILTATRTKRQLSSLPLPVTLISNDIIEQSGTIRVSEILNEQTGMITIADESGFEGIQIQGISSEYIMVLIDGVPLIGRSAGSLDLSRLAIGNIKQIEVVKGPSSSLFGSEALGGVINIITTDPTSEKISGQLSHRVASFNNQNTNLGLNQKIGKITYSLFADRLSTDNFDLAPDLEGQSNAPFKNYTATSRFTADLSSTFRVFASGRYFHQEFDIDPSKSEETDLNLHLRLDHTPSKKLDLQYELYYTNYKTSEQFINTETNVLLFENDFNQKLLRPEIRFNYKLKKSNTLSMGAGYNFETLDRTLFAEDISFDSQYIFTQFDIKPTKGFNVIVGARFDNHSEYNSRFSPKISARYDLTSNFAIKGSVGSGFKAPDFRQLYLNFTNTAGGNYTVFGKEVEAAGIERLEENGEILRIVDLSGLGEPLRAETSVGYNLGFVYKKGMLSSEINFFRNDFKDLIDTRILAVKTNGASVFGYQNFNRIYTQGVEVDLSFKPFNSLTFSGGYQLLFAYDKDQEDEIEQGTVFARDPETSQTLRLSRSDYFGLINRSRHTANIKVFYEIPKWKANANIRVIYRSRYGLADLNGNAVLDEFDDSFVHGYAVVNFATQKTFFKNYQLQAGVNNLFDFKGSNPVASDTDSNVQISPGIQVFAKLNYKF